jgi:uncharacterized surface protein with fasciclin (FAS1) repeats
VALALLGAACTDDADEGVVISGQDPASAPRDLVDTALDGGFGTLVAAVQEAGLEDLLRSDGPFTVFAPPDTAFAALPEGAVDALLEPRNRDLLTDILTYHVADGLVFAADVVETDSIETLQGDSLEVEVTEEPPAEEGGEPTTTVTVDGVTVSDTDLLATNGIIHVVDEVLVPASAQAELRRVIADIPEQVDLLTTADDAGEFTTLLAAIDAAGLTSALEGEGPLTVFAPTDDAFDALPPGLVDALLEPANRDVLESLLRYHVIGREFADADVSVREVVPTLLDGESLVLEHVSDTLLVNGVEVVTPDVRATNGIIHVIDEVLVPESITLP